MVSLPSAMHAELVAQHVRLRALLLSAESAARRYLAGDPAADFRAALDALRGALSVHHQYEERVYESLLREGESTGTLRVERMIRDHENEHVAMLELLELDAQIVVDVLAELADDLIAHIAAEERIFLGAR